MTKLNVYEKKKTMRVCNGFSSAAHFFRGTPLLGCLRSAQDERQKTFSSAEQKRLLSFGGSWCLRHFQIVIPQAKSCFQ
jgi:UDP-N-acetylglucosamine:LPS N-acetylglucosamine transferase